MNAHTGAAARAAQVDPNLAAKSLGKIEDDVPALFKRLRYPFGISKSSLFAVGSPHTWPSLLAALTWLVELLNYEEKAVRGPARTRSLAQATDSAPARKLQLGPRYACWVAYHRARLHAVSGAGRLCPSAPRSHDLIPAERRAPSAAWHAPACAKLSGVLARGRPPPRASLTLRPAPRPPSPGSRGTAGRPTVRKARGRPTRGARGARQAAARGEGFDGRARPEAEFFGYVARAYRCFLAGDDAGAEAADAEQAAAFEARGAAVAEHNRRFEQVPPNKAPRGLGERAAPCAPMHTLSAASLHALMDHGTKLTHVCSA